MSNPKAFGWAADEGGCYYYRLKMPMDALAETDGWEVSHSTRFPGLPKIPPNHPELPRIAEQVASRLDLVIAQRTSQPAAGVFWDMLRHTDVGRIYEIDDDLLSIDRNSNPAGHQFYNLPEIRNVVEKSVASADAVTVSTERLVEIFRKLNPRVFLCPNAIPDWLLKHERPRRDRLTIGWAGSTTHQMDFAEANGALRQLLGRRDDIDFHTIGANYTGRVSHPGRIRWTPWIASTEDYYKLVDFDIGIAPLRPHLFNQSKSYIKALEYAALGIPVVASRVGPYQDFVQHGKTGFLVKYSHEWGKYLLQLINDPDMRAEMGQNARELAQSYTITRLLPNWREAWNSCL